MKLSYEKSRICGWSAFKGGMICGIALASKIAFTLALLYVILDRVYHASFLSVMFIALFLGFVSYLSGDMLVLPRTNNITRLCPKSHIKGQEWKQSLKQAQWYVSFDHLNCYFLKKILGRKQMINNAIQNHS